MKHERRKRDGKRERKQEGKEETKRERERKGTKKGRKKAQINKPSGSPGFLQLFIGNLRTALQNKYSGALLIEIKIIRRD